MVENLAVRNLVKNPKLAKSISDAGWGQFCTMLKYKAEWEGKIYIEVDRFFPSSKTCSNCLNPVDSLSLDIAIGIVLDSMIDNRSRIYFTNY